MNMKRNYTILMTAAMAAMLMWSCSKNNDHSDNIQIPYLTDSLRKVVTVATVQNHAFAD